VAGSAATSYDGLSSCLVPQIELKAFLLDCFGVAEREVFVGHEDRTAEDLRDVSREVVFAAFCTYWPVSGHFAMGYSIGIEGRLADRVGRREFAERFAARFDANVLYSDTEPPGLWTVILKDGGHVLAAMDEQDQRYVLYAATAPVPGLPEVRVNENL
jgi:hypothetical protein